MRVRGIRLFKELLGMAGLLWDPHAIQNIYRIEDGLLNADVSRGVLSRLQADPGVASIVAGRYLRGEVPDLDALRELPDGTLGREYVRHIEDYGFNPGYYQTLPVVDDVTYALARVRETHDIWHVVLGFHPTPIGEIGLKAFELTQLSRPMAGVIVAGGILRHLVADADLFPDVLAAIAGGYEQGRQAGPLLAERWEQRWDEPVAEIRRRLGVVELSPRAAGFYDHRGVKPSRAESDRPQPATPASALGDDPTPAPQRAEDWSSAAWPTHAQPTRSSAA